MTSDPVTVPAAYGMINARMNSARKLPSGRQPYDPLNGARVGALAGGLIGGLVIAIAGAAAIWWVFGCAAAGAGLGYWIERRKLAAAPPTDDTAAH